MIDRLLAKVTRISTSELNDLVEKLLHIEKPTTLGFLNQYGYNLAYSGKKNWRSFLGVDYLLRDGRGIEIAFRMNSVDPGKNMNGTDFIPKLISRFIDQHPEAQCFAYGTESPWLEMGAERIFHGKAFDSLDGFREQDAYINHFLSRKIENNISLVLLCMGMPKQEEVARKLKSAADGKVLIVCGGAVLDFAAGKITRAPATFRKHGFEWLYRLAIEPKRLFSRYVFGIPVFFLRVLSRSQGAPKTFRSKSYLG